MTLEHLGVEGEPLLLREFAQMAVVTIFAVDLTRRPSGRTGAVGLLKAKTTKTA